MPIKFPDTIVNHTNQHLDATPVLMRKAIDPNYYNWQDINEMVSRSDFLSKDFKLMDGGIVPKHEYVENYIQVGNMVPRLVKPVIYDRLRAGATLIVNKIRGDSKISDLERQIARLTGRETLTSGYVAFGAKSSFRSHWDTRDLLAIQFIGRKRWIIHVPSMEAPLYMQQSKDVEKEYPRPAEPFMDIVLEPGDVLYLPRGWWHDPLPLGEQSFHLTVGMYPPMIFEYLQWVCQKMPAFVEARQSMGTWEQDELTLASVGKILAEFMQDETNHRAFIEEFSGRQRVDSPFAIEVFGNQNSAGIGEEDRIALNALRLHELEAGQVIANGVKLTLDEMSLPLVKHIAAHPKTSLHALRCEFPNLDGTKIKGLVEALCRQDVLALYRPEDHRAVEIQP